MNRKWSDPSCIKKFREKWLKKGYDLVDITQLCKVEINCHGNCNSFNEPDENIYHIKIKYREEIIGACIFNQMYSLDEDKYLVWGDEECCGEQDFIIFRKVKL